MSDAAIDIRFGEVTWAKPLDGNRSQDQERIFKKLIDASSIGVVLDCAAVQVANSELINVLMRSRNYAKKHQKHLVLCGVPETLRKLLAIAHLGSVLPSAGDSVEASELIQDLARGKGRGYLWVKAHKVAASLIVVGSCLGLGSVAYFFLG